MAIYKICNDDFARFISETNLYFKFDSVSGNATGVFYSDATGKYNATIKEARFGGRYAIKNEYISPQIDCIVEDKGIAVLVNFGKIDYSIHGKYLNYDRYPWFDYHVEPFRIKFFFNTENLESHEDFERMQTALCSEIEQELNDRINNYLVQDGRYEMNFRPNRKIKYNFIIKKGLV